GRIWLWSSWPLTPVVGGLRPRRRSLEKYGCGEDPILTEEGRIGYWTDAILPRHGGSVDILLRVGFAAVRGDLNAGLVREFLPHAGHPQGSRPQLRRGGGRSQIAALRRQAQAQQRMFSGVFGLGHGRSSWRGGSAGISQSSARQRR